MTAQAGAPDLARLCFRWPWRDYQARVLDALQSHLSNDRLHVVAAPGSGKTVLGLEVFRRLGRPTLVLSPTRTIRDQWIDRLGDFLPEGTDPGALDWQSRELAAPAFFNSLTYQALHTRMRLDAAEVEEAEAEELELETDGAGPSAEEISEVARHLEAAGIGVLILDEAHHLRAEWWVALQSIVEHLPGLQVVSLTATPPYDVVGREWVRYIDLCGPIDEEISVPELVKAGTLCPHQDFVWLVECQGGDATRLAEHEDRVTRLLNALSVDEQLLADARAHDWVREPEAHLAAISDNPRQAMALCALLHAAGHTPQALMHTVDVDVEDLPRLSPADWEHLLRLYLFGAGWPEDTASSQRRQELARHLRHEELLWRRELAVAHPGRRWPRLALGASKADACVDIHRLECRVRGEALCQVILTDYIRDEEYAKPVQGALSLGAWPVFHRLANGASPCRTAALALHTGRLSIVHRELLPVLEAMPECPAIDTREVPALGDFVELRSRGGQRLTRALTRLLVEGRVQVLVGTRALLGEGWDAPPVNSLVLASVVGSFMTTNQMRGRAIRTDRHRPDKVASIWHIGAFARLGPDRFDLRDLADMQARFETFVGLAHARPVIEGGLQRLDPGFLRRNRLRMPVWVRRRNRVMEKRLERLDQVARGWREAVDHSQVGQVLPSVHVPKPPRFNPLDFRGTLAVLLAQLGALVMLVTAGVLQVLIPTQGQGQALPGWLLPGVALVVAAISAPAALRVLRLYLRFLPVDGALRGICLAVRDALVATGQLPRALERSRVIVGGEAAGGFTIALAEGSLAERALFADCVSQVLSPIDRPRYLVTRRQARRVGHALDHHAVPAVLGSRAERAQAFLQAWHRHVSQGELIYTRSEDGRRELARARFRSFAAAAEDLARRMDRWF